MTVPKEYRPQYTPPEDICVFVDDEVKFDQDRPRLQDKLVLEIDVKEGSNGDYACYVRLHEDAGTVKLHATGDRGRNFVEALWFAGLLPETHLWHKLEYRQ